MNPERLTPEFLENANAYQEEIQNIYQAADLVGVFLMAIMGGTIARHKGYDLVGFFFLALISATGGGMIRDTLIQKGTVAAMEQPHYLILATAGAAVAWLAHFKGRTWDLIQGNADGIIMGTWAVTGASKALTWDLPLFSALFMGVITATGGSLIRDIILGQRPKIFRGEQLMVIPALLAAGVYAAFHYADQPVLGMIFGAVAGSALALISYWAGISLPANPDFAPANVAAEKVEEVADKVGDKTMEKIAEVEPERSRELRHEIGIVHKESGGGAQTASDAGSTGAGEEPPLQTESVTAEDEQEIASRSADNIDGGDGASQAGQREGSYRFEDVLRELHADKSELGQETERAFIGEWLAWQEEYRHADDDAINAGDTRLLRRKEEGRESGGE